MSAGSIIGLRWWHPDDVSVVRVATCQFPVSARIGANLEQDLYDSTAVWRDRAMAGVLHSGTLVSDPRSADQTAL
jgi:hypothetical protein